MQYFSFFFIPIYSQFYIFVFNLFPVTYNCISFHILSFPMTKMLTPNYCFLIHSHLNLKVIFKKSLIDTGISFCSKNYLIYFHKRQTFQVYTCYSFLVLLKFRSVCSEFILPNILISLFYFALLYLCLAVNQLNIEKDTLKHDHTLCYLLFFLVFRNFCIRPL